jgi:hypothetical protein
MRLTALLGATMVIASVTTAQTVKEPWKWTIEERLQARFDAGA